MAKSAIQIRLDYNNAIRQADALSQVAAELRSAAKNEMQEGISVVSENWTGSNAAAYINKCRKLQSNILTTATKVEKAASAIRTIAKNTYNAEMKALLLAQTRTY